MLPEHSVLMEQGPEELMRENSWSVSRLHIHQLQSSSSIPHPALFLFFPRSPREEELISRSGERQEEPRLLLRGWWDMVLLRLSKIRPGT